MKHVKITPEYKIPYTISIGGRRLTFDSKRKAISEADVISRDLTECLADLNGIYTEYFMHLRRMWILECPSYSQLDKFREAIDYYMNRISAGHNLSKPVENMITVIETFRQGFDEMKRFYQLRNHSILKQEIRKLITQLQTLQQHLDIYLRKTDTFLFLEKSVKCKKPINAMNFS